MFSFYGLGKELYSRREGMCPSCGLLVDASTESCVHCDHVFSIIEKCSIESQAEHEHQKFLLSVRNWSFVFLIGFSILAIIWMWVG